LAFSGDPGPGPYTAQSPDYVPGHDNPVNIVSSNNTWTFDINGQLTVPGNVVPVANNTHDLGTPDKQWRHIYVSTGSIYLGGVKLSTNNNQLSVQQVTNIGGQETVVQNYALTNADRIVAGNKTFSIDGNGIFTFPDNTLDNGNNSLYIRSQQYIEINSDDYVQLQYTNPNVQINVAGNVFAAGFSAGPTGLFEFSGPAMYSAYTPDGDHIEEESVWFVNNRGNLTTGILQINTQTGVYSERTGDIVDIYNQSIIHPIAGDIPPQGATAGRLWFNSEEGRLYIRYNDQWVDASPTVIPPPAPEPTRAPPALQCAPKMTPQGRQDASRSQRASSPEWQRSQTKRTRSPRP
jgi:hypothetical protein